MKKQKRLDSKDRKHLIVKATIECIAKEGVHQTTFSKIAKMVKIQQPLINYYYPTFESLLVDCVLALLEDIRAHSISALELGGSNPERALWSYIKAPLLWAEEKPHFQPLWVYFYHLSTNNPRFRKINQEVRHVGRERISMLLFRILEKSKVKLKAPTTVDSLSWSLQALITGYMTMVVTEDSNFKEASRLLEIQYRELVSSILGT